VLGGAAFRVGGGGPGEGGAARAGVGEVAGAFERLAPPLFSHFYHVLRCELTGDAASALAHARATVEYAEQSGITHGRIGGYLCLGIANLLNRAGQVSLEALEEALAIGRERRLRLQEAGLLTTMASAHLGFGDCKK